MTLKNTVDRWGPVSQGLHWLIVGGIGTRGALAMAGRSIAQARTRRGGDTPPAGPLHEPDQP